MYKISTTSLIVVELVITYVLLETDLNVVFYMQVKCSEASSVTVGLKAAKLAVIGNPILIPVPPLLEPEDSGIDSDDTNALRAALAACEFSESSCSDEEFSEMCWRLRQLDIQAQLEMNIRDRDRDRDIPDFLIQWKSHNGDMESSLINDNPARSSPPLYEVELTASDEDDDASVLELVIPMQSRYQRVPTSSPKKVKKTKSCFAKLFCCFKK